MKLKKPAFETILKDVACTIKQKTDMGEKFSSHKVFQMLLAVDNAGIEKRDEIKKAILLPLGKDQAIYCKRDAFGKVVIVLDRVARFTKREEILASIEKAIDNYVLS